MASKTELKEILKLNNQLCFPLYAAARLVAQAYGPSLKKMKITYPQYLVLMVLWEQDGLTVTDIGEKLLLDSGTLTPILKKLELGDFVVRKRSDVDDRTVLNFLTKKGRSLKAKAGEMSIALFCKSGLTADEAESLRAATKNLIAKLQNILANQDS